MKIWFTDKSEFHPSRVWISENDLITFEIDGKEYEVSIQELISAHLELLEEGKEEDGTSNE